MRRLVRFAERILPIAILAMAVVGVPVMMLAPEGLPRLRSLSKELAQVESENAEQEEFGPKRLSALLSGFSQRHSAREITEQIMAATDGHSGAGIAPHDDRTLVVLRVTDEPSSDFSKLPIIY